MTLRDQVLTALRIQTAVCAAGVAGMINCDGFNMCVWLLVWDNQDLLMGTCFQSLYISIGKWSSLCDSYDTQHINTVWLCRCIIWMSICVCMNPRFLDSKSQRGNAVGVVCACARWGSRTFLEHTDGCHSSPSWVTEIGILFLGDLSVSFWEGGRFLSIVLFWDRPGTPDGDINQTGFDL